MKVPLYIPSIAEGPMGRDLFNGTRFPDGTPMRYWDVDYPLANQHKAFLYPATKYFDEPDIISKFGFPKDMVVFGDSGGFQILKGTIKLTPGLCKKVFDWLENNSTIAMNLDIPPDLMWKDKFEHALDVSLQHFEYFHKHQSGKTDFLGCIQGGTVMKYFKWYEACKKYQFQGWAIGRAQIIQRQLSGLAVLLQGGEHLKPHNKYLHFLGLSKVVDFLTMGQIQKSLEEVGSNMQVLFDSSSPAIGARFGTWYVAPNWKTCSWMSISPTPRVTKEGIWNEPSPLKLLPGTQPIDDVIRRNYALEDICQRGELSYSVQGTHNLSVFIDGYHTANQITYLEPTLRGSIIAPEVNLLLTLIDKIIKSKTPMEEFLANFKVIDKISTSFGGDAEVTGDLGEYFG